MNRASKQVLAAGCWGLPFLGQQGISRDWRSWRERSGPQNRSFTRSRSQGI